MSACSLRKRSSLTIVAHKLADRCSYSSPGALQRARGKGAVTTQQREGTTRLATLYQDGCAKIRLPHTHTDALQAVLMNTAGGLTGGDHLRWTMVAQAGAKLVMTTPACERAYRSTGADAKFSLIRTT